MAGQPLAEAEDKHAAAKVKLAQALALRDSHLEDLKQRQRHRLDAATALESSEKELHFCKERAERAEEHSVWLADIIGHCKEAEAKRVFEGPVVEAFGEAVQRLLEAGELQRSQAREAAAVCRRVGATRETATRELTERVAREAAAQAGIHRIEDELQVYQCNIQRYAERTQHLRVLVQAEQEASSLLGEAQKLQAAAREASGKRHQTMQRLDEHRAWTEDLQLFFKGSRPRDSNALLRGLQVLLPKGDPLPIIVSAMLSEKRIDVNSSTVISVSKMMNEHMHCAEARLRETVQKCTSVCQDTERRLDEASKLLHQQNTRVKGMRSQASCHSLATPLRNAAGNEVPRRSPSTGGVTFAAAAESPESVGTAGEAPPKSHRLSAGSVPATSMQGTGLMWQRR